MCSLFAKQVARNTFQTYICQNGKIECTTFCSADLAVNGK